MHTFQLQVFTDPERTNMIGEADIVLRPAAAPSSVYGIANKYFKEYLSGKYCSLINSEGHTICKYPLQ